MEYGLLEFGVVDTQGSGTELVSVQAQVETCSSDILIVQIVLGQDEGVVERIVLTGDGIDLEHGALIHPEELELVLGNDVQILRDLLPEESCALVCGLPGSGDDEQQVTLLRAHGGLDVLEDLGCEVLHDVALELSVDTPHPGESSESDLLGIVDVTVHIVPSNLLSGDIGLQVHSRNDSTLCEDVLEYLVRSVPDDIRQFHELKSVPHIGLIGSEPLHCITVCDVGEGRLKVLSVESLPDVGHHALHHVLDVLHVDEGHLHIELREFWLPVLPGILITEASGDLIVTVHACDHEHLLELLRGLRQGVECSGMYPGRNDIVPCSLGCGPSEDGRLYLEEAVLFEILPGEMDELAPELHGLYHLGPPEVEIPVLHPDVLVGKHSLLLVTEFEGRRGGFVEKLRICDEDLDLPRGVPGVGRSLDPLSDDTVYRDDGFTCECLHDVGKTGCIGPCREVLGIEDYLRDSVPVREVDECDPSVVPGESDPSLETHLFSEVCGPQFAACVCSSHESASITISHAI